MATFAPPRADPATAVKWFEETTTVDGEFRELLEKYSHVPPGEVVSHVVQTRNRAWAIHPYPCLGQFRFLELNLAKRGDLYARLLASLKSGGGRFLDVGCCLGQDVRKLVFDGALAASVAGAELNAAFIDLGYELFRDRANTDTKFMSANILEPVAEGSLAPFVGQFTAVQLGMILHLFTWEQQLAAFTNALALLRGQPGDRIFGQATGHVDGTPTASAGHRPTFKHSAETFRRLVAEWSEQTGTRWRVVQAELDNQLSIFDGKRFWDNPKTRRLVFEIERE